jgi:branched-chain amino acid transport system ATP-binding protein
MLARLRKQGANSLSGGERKLLAIGKALMTRPTLLILDEPTANLAPRVAHELLESHIRNLVQHGTTVLFVEQRALDALAISEWAYVMVNGEVRLSGSAADVRSNSDFTDVFLGGTPPSRS